MQPLDRESSEKLTLSWLPSTKYHILLQSRKGL